MAGLTAPRFTGDKRTFGEKTFKQKGGTIIYPGACCALNGGYLAPTTAAAGLVIVGPYMRDTASDNSAGADGALTVTVSLSTGVEGTRLYAYDNDSGAGKLLQSDLGIKVYWLDDHTVTKTSSGNSQGGTFVDLDASGQCWINFDK
jgi:hypothetical protein